MALCDTITVDTCRHKHVQTMDKSEPQCEPWSLGDDDVSV